MLLKNKNHHPQSPLYWKDPGTEVIIHLTEKKSWDAFYQEIVTFTQRNNQPTPSDEDVQNFVCKQLGAGWCVELPNFQVPPDAGRQGCKSCGGR